MLHVNHTSVDRDVLCGRLLELWEQTGSPALQALANGQSPIPGGSVDTAQSFIDWVSTSLMDCFKDSGNSAVFALLFELNRDSFLHAIQCNLRRSYHHVDPNDVLQEVFLNIYRYPHRFLGDKSDAFRGWGHRIARNTLLKFLKGQTRLSRFQAIDDEVIQPEDTRSKQPDRAATDAESAVVVDRAYLMYLQLYMLHFGRLSAKERRALTMVEVEDRSYRDAAEELGIRLENLKMVIFRGRRKIFRGMERSLTSLAGQHADASSAVLSLGAGTQQAAVSESVAPQRAIQPSQVAAADCDHLTRICNGSKLVCDHTAQGV